MSEFKVRIIFIHALKKVSSKSKQFETLEILYIERQINKRTYSKY